MFEDIYLTVTSPCEGVYKEKGSKFIALLYPVTTEAEVKDILSNLRKQYHDARHHCYSYVIGHDRSTFRINDDGEPSGTAGKPIYGQILSKGITNVLIVVVRYFGGTLLGVSGLIRAYRTAAKEAIDNAQIVEKTVEDVYVISFIYESMNDIMKCLKENNVTFISQNFENVPELKFSVRKMLSDKIYECLRKIEGLKNIRYDYSF